MVLLAGVFATQRKTGPMVLGAGLLTFLIYQPRQMFRLAPVGLLLLLAMPVVAPSALGSLRDQLNPSQATGTLSSRDRVSDYDAIEPELLNHPALGRGWQTYDPERYRVLDNEYLAILIGNGWLGLGAFVLMLIAALTVCTRAIRTNDPDPAPRRPRRRLGGGDDGRRQRHLRHDRLPGRPLRVLPLHRAGSGLRAGARGRARAAHPPASLATGGDYRHRRAGVPRGQSG